jgi:hypothetical protein
VLQKVYEKLQFIEHRTEASCRVLRLKKEGGEMISIHTKNNSLDLSTPEGIHAALIHQTSDLTFFTNEKNYTKEREMEIHEMLEQGCVNSSEAFWMQLNKALS